MLNAPDQHYERLCNLKEDWERWLVSPKGVQKDIVNTAVNSIMEIIEKQTFKQARVNEVQAKLTYKQGSLVDSLTKTKLFPVVEKFVSSLNSNLLSKLSIFSEWALETVFIIRKSDKPKGKFTASKKRKKKLVRTDVKMNTFNNTAMLTTWLLFWPYDLERYDSNSSALLQSVHGDLETFPASLIDTFHHQLSFVIKVVEASTMNTFKSKALKRRSMPGL